MKSAQAKGGAHGTIENGGSVEAQTCVDEVKHKARFGVFGNFRAQVPDTTTQKVDVTFMRLALSRGLARGYQGGTMDI